MKTPIGNSELKPCLVMQDTEKATNFYKGEFGAKEIYGNNILLMERA
jgi:uncharacterized glyoxalase superfamily protein PhnB